jgi:hypothetical protein
MSGRIFSVGAKVVVASFFMAISFAGSARAATITVTTTNVTGSASDCTFPDALNAASTNVAVNGCAAGDNEPTVDTINLPAGTITADSSNTFTLSDSTSIHGAGMSSTTLLGYYLYSDSGAPSLERLEFHNLTLSQGEVYMYNPVANFVLDYVGLDFMYVTIMSYSDDMPLAASLTNIRAVNDATVAVYQSSNNPGNVLIRNAYFNTDSSLTSGNPAIIYKNERANARFDIQNSVITGYTIGILNQECTDMVWSPWSVYVTDSMIGGAGMQTGIINNCGHLVINRTTFHDITGTAIMAWANYLAVNQNTGVCEPQSSSRLEVYNSTFSGITVSGSLDTRYPLTDAPFSTTLVTPYIGIVTVDSQVNPTCPAGSQVTDTDITLVHNTFADNTFTTPGSGIIGFQNGTVLRNLRVQNNAIQGKAFSGNFSANGTVNVSDNLITESYAGPGVFATGFLTVADFLLGPLQDNGGAGVGVDQAGGRVLTMRPFAGSPLIDAASSAGLAEDERGASRSLMMRFDVGAVEVTVAEFTADGGVYTPPTGRLAETGSDVYGYFTLGGMVSVSAGIVLCLRYKKSPF